MINSLCYEYWTDKQKYLYVYQDWNRTLFQHIQLKTEPAELESKFWHWRQRDSDTYQPNCVITCKILEKGKWEVVGFWKEGCLWKGGEHLWRSSLSEKGGEPWWGWVRLGKRNIYIHCFCNLPKSVVANWVKSKVCFVLLKLSICLHGTQTVCRKVVKLECDADVFHDLACNFLLVCH